MKFRVLLATLCLLFGATQAFAISQTISIDGIEPLIGTDTVAAGDILKIHLRYTNASDTGFNITNGFQITSPDGATWTDSAAGNFKGANLGPIGIDTTGLLSKSQFPLQFALRTWINNSTTSKADGISPDLVSFSGIGVNEGEGLPPQFDGRVFTVRLKTKAADNGKTICFDSSAIFPPSLTWKWACLYPITTGTIQPGWSGKRCIKIVDTSATVGTLQVSPGTLTFDAVAGGANPPTQLFAVTEAGGGAVSYASSETAAWINLTNPNGTTPGNVTVGVDIAGKTAGTYTDSVQVTSAEVSNSPQWVKVILNVAAPKVLVVAPTTLNFSATQGGANPIAQSYNVSEQGGAVIAYTSTESAAWINLTTPNGNTPGSVGVNVDITGKTAGIYNDSILVTAAAASNPTIWVKVNLTIEAAPKSLAVAPTLLNFEATQGGANPVSQTFDVTEVGGGTIAFSATEGAAWFSLSNASGNTPGTVTVNVDITGLAEGMYLDSVAVASGEATNSPQYVKVHLTVNASPKTLVVAPDSLHFDVTSSNPVAPSQTFDVTELGGASIPYAASESATWITLTNPSGNTPGTVTVNVDGTALPVGDYKDSVTVVASATNSPQTVIVTLHVSACPILVASKNSFNAAGLTGETITLVDSVGITSSGEVLDFAANPAAHFVFSPASGNTPGQVGFTFSNSYVAAGEYTECFTVATGELVPQGCQGSSVEICVHVTVTEPPKHLVVAPTSLNFNAVIGGSNPTPQIFMVSEQGGANITYAVTESAGWFALNKANGNTPDSVQVSVDLTGLSAGSYIDSVQVTSGAVVNSPQWVIVNLNIIECPILQLDKIAVYDTITEGETSSLSGTLKLTSTGPGERGWIASLDTVFALDDSAGTTPSDINYTFTAKPVGVGTHQYCFQLVSTDQPSYPCGNAVTFCANVLVLKAASADTLIVVNTPAVPGARVVVPINFKNDCTLLSASFGLTFDASNLYLDSVSFGGSRVAGFGQLNVSINNTTGHVGFDLAANGSGAAAPGFGLLADMHFTVRPEAPETTYPLVLIDTVMFGRDCGQGLVLEQPEFIPGNILVATETNFVCGYVVDPEGNEIPGATVLLYADWPNGSPLASTTSSAIGSWAFSDFTAIPFDVYAYKTGYYPGWVENLNYGDKGVKIVLTPIKTFTPTSQWVDYYCNENMLFGAPLPIGSVVEAYTPGMLLVGQFTTTEAGKYGFMPVYRANSTFSDDGAVTGDVITFFINGIQAIPTAVYPAEYAQVNLCLEAGEEVTKTCTLQEGWNLVSWNVNTASDNIETVLGPYMNCIDVVLGFEQGGLTFDPELQEFSTLWSVDHLSGYWIKVKQGCPVTLELTGTAVPVSTPIPVYPGWNLVSYLPETTMLPVDGFASLTSNLLFAYGWDAGIKVFSPGAGGFNDLSLLEPCNGYWVKVTDGDNLEYPGGQPGVAPRYAVQNSNIAANGVTPTTAWVNLYAANLNVDGHTVTAGSTITAHAANGAKVGTFTMTRDGKFGFMPVYADASSDLKPGESFYIAVNGVETQEQFTWTTNGDRVEVGSLTTASGSGALPGSFSLGQNYPNPFNPSTTISFSVPVAGNAKIEIYNVLGALIAVPFDGAAVAGDNTVVWDGRDLNGESVASGIYLYRLTAGAASETKKMMLLK